MATYSVSDAKNRLSALLAKVRRGARIVITDRGVPVAVLVPLGSVDAPPSTSSVRLAGLVRDGLVSRRRTPLPPSILTQAPPVPARKESAVQTLLDERANTR